MIEINKLSKKYKQRTSYAVDGMNLCIPKRGIFGILGPNGAGKTTLISMLCGLMKPTSGHFTINGLSYEKNRKELQKNIGVVPQEYALYPTLTAAENLYYFGSLYGIDKLTLKKKIQKELENHGLAEFANKKIGQFSGGMKRRVNLIAGVLHRPKVLFLDEPTVGVDIHSKTVIIDQLNKICAKGTSIIYTSHHLREAEYFCDQIMIMDHGKRICCDSPKNLIEHYQGAQHLEDVFLLLTGIKPRDYA